MSLSEKSVAFLAKGATRIGSVDFHTFYECPVDGDESPLWAIDCSGKLRKTGFWELPEASELTGVWWLS